MTNTKRLDWATIIDNNREALMDAFAEATALALRNGQDEFIVYLWADGETEIFQNTGNSYLEAEGLREIKGFRYVGWSPMDWYGDDEVMLEDMRAAMSESQLAELDKATDEDDLDEFEQMEWIEKNAPAAYNSAYERAIKGETSDSDAYDEMIDTAIADERREAKELERMEREARMYEED